MIRTLAASIALLLPGTSLPMVSVPRPILFSPSTPTSDTMTSFAWSDEQRERLEEAANWIKRNPKGRYVLFAHSDDRECGIELECDALRQRRFDIVAAYLKAHGVQPSQILWFEGKQAPLQTDATEADRERARSVEFYPPEAMHCNTLTDAGCIRN